jgi:hypothetical protein
MTGGTDWTRKGRNVNASKTLMIETLCQFASGDPRSHDLPLRQEIEEDPPRSRRHDRCWYMVISQSRNASGHGDLWHWSDHWRLCTVVSPPQDMIVTTLIAVTRAFGTDGAARAKEPCRSTRHGKTPRFFEVMVSLVSPDMRASYHSDIRQTQN